jgi:hypothetical protein
MPLWGQVELLRASPRLLLGAGGEPTRPRAVLLDAPQPENGNTPAR